MHTRKTKNQMGRASQLWTRNQSLERDFLDMGITATQKGTKEKAPRRTGPTRREDTKGAAVF
jgi:hypothetical protein